MRVHFVTMPSPVGELLLAARDDGLTCIRFEENRHAERLEAAWVPDDGRGGPASDVLALAREQLDAYFAGARTTFALPLAARGTPFQARVWAALRMLGFGETISYAGLARRIGSPDAVRAVGAANGRNPLPVVVPCHRVIGADGSLTGFGGGIERKRWLLRHEGALLV
ncbi:MAG TPA: methylated-DNA--[protein]-cysteine S-methyltransferase [Gemmatimonadaceae bacterium]|nr:methylated-DNA--[protein]-cysteine S-methyltransferase [Gemmatimonadaceae bacterium]